MSAILVLKPQDRIVHRMQAPGIYVLQAMATETIAAEASLSGIASSDCMIHSATTQMDVAVTAHLSGSGDPFGRARTLSFEIFNNPQVLTNLPDEVFHTIDYCNRTLLHHAADGKCGVATEVVAWECLQRMDTAEVNSKSSRGWTALHYAASHGEARVCTMLLKHPKFTEALATASHNITYQGAGFTAWRLAVEYGHNACASGFF